MELDCWCLYCVVVGNTYVKSMASSVLFDAARQVPFWLNSSTSASRFASKLSSVSSSGILVCQFTQPYVSTGLLQVFLDCDFFFTRRLFVFGRRLFLYAATFCFYAALSGLLSV